MKNKDFENETTLDEESSLSVSPDTDDENTEDIPINYDEDEEETDKSEDDGWWGVDSFADEKQVVFVVTGHDGKDSLKNLTDDEEAFFKTIRGFVFPYDRYKGLPKNERFPIDSSFIWRTDASNAIKYRGNRDDIELLERELPKRFEIFFSGTSHSVKKLAPLTREFLISKIEEHTKDKVESLQFYGERIAVIKFKSGREESLNRPLFRELVGIPCIILEKEGYDTTVELEDWPFDTAFYCD